MAGRVDVDTPDSVTDLADPPHDNIAYLRGVATAQWVDYDEFICLLNSSQETGVDAIIM
jgi:hypothetical protein